MPHSIVVVPCYNEALRFDVRRYGDFARRHHDVQFLLIDDGSRDETLRVLARLHDELPQQFLVHRLPCNQGKAEAVRQGMLRALAQNPDYVGFWDADLATPLESIPEFIHTLDRRPDVDAVIGCRLRLLGRRIERRPMRRLLSRVFAWAAARTLRIPIRDTQCGAKMFRRSPRVEAAFARPFTARWVFDVELLARLLKTIGQRDGQAQTAIYELPLDEWHDVAGSKIKPRDMLRIGGELLAIHWRYAVVDRWFRPFSQPSGVVGEATTDVLIDAAPDHAPLLDDSPRRAA